MKSKKISSYVYKVNYDKNKVLKMTLKVVNIAEEHEHIIVKCKILAGLF